MRRAAALAAAMVVLLTTGAVAAAGTRRPGARGSGITRCDWPMWGRTPQRTFAAVCAGGISPATVAKLHESWFFNTNDVVTATPAVVGGVAYVGDWSGRFYAVDVRSGKPRWTFRARTAPLTYAGQIVSSAAVADAGGTRTVYFGAAKTLYALRARDGALRWRHRFGTAAASDPTEIESSPVVVGNTVVVGWDVHNSDQGQPAGVMALDAATGALRWRQVTAPTTGAGATGPGCGDVWSSPSVDTERELVFVGTGNCVTSPLGWGTASEALLALDLRTGTRRWSYQPHSAGRDDLDFAGAPNLFRAAGRDLVGLGNKDANYYAVDRDTGALVWKARATDPGISHPGGNYSTGGFIGPTAVAGGTVVGGTAVGGSPYLHAFDTATGATRWQQPIAGPTYGATTATNGVVFSGGTDFTLRAYALESGKVLWEQPMKGVVAGGVAVVGDDVIAVAGIREPGLNQRSKTSGVYRFSLSGPRRATTSTKVPATTTTAAAATTEPPRTAQRCLGTPCSMNFDLKKPPAGRSPSATLVVDESPFSLSVTAKDLGPPIDWLRPGSAAAQAGATRYGVFLSESDDNPTGGLICILDASLQCQGSKIPRPGATYNRVTIVAVKDVNTLPTLSDGYDRLVSTVAFKPPLAPKAAP
ncbi:MAG: PQQ-binding-like beta-propeller repeat protein [Acidimicrobiia bacterium]